jgi:hypothetical protein
MFSCGRNRTVVRTLAQLAALVMTVSLSAQSLEPEPASPLSDEARFASQELEVAKAGGFYYVLDIQGKILTLKLRGVELRSYPLQSVELGVPMGGPADPDWLQRVYLFHREVTDQPQQIEPGGPSPENPLLAVDSPATPSSFTMSCDSGLSIRIRADSEHGFWSSMADRWALDEPTRSVRLRLRLTDADAHGLYRSLPDKANILFKPVS